MTNSSPQYTIGELARQTDVPIKTIRYYSDIGLLPPSDHTPAGYRLYCESDRVRLELIRTLRNVGFDLPTIARLVQGDLSIKAAVEMQYQALILQMRALHRQQSILQAALTQAADDEAEMLTYLQHIHKLERLNTLERSAFLQTHFAQGLADVPIDPLWQNRFMQAAFDDLPNDMSESQWAAYLELVALVTDEDFLASLRENARPFWQAAQANFDYEAWESGLNEIHQAGMQAFLAGEASTSPAAQTIAQRFVALNAQVIGGQPTPEFATQLIANFEKYHDPRATRFWELVAIIRNTPPPTQFNAMYAWLLQAIRASVQVG